MFWFCLFLLYEFSLLTEVPFTDLLLGYKFPQLMSPLRGFFISDYVYFFLSLLSFISSFLQFPSLCWNPLSAPERCFPTQCLFWLPFSVSVPYHLLSLFGNICPLLNIRNPSCPEVSDYLLKKKENKNSSLLELPFFTSLLW